MRLPISILAAGVLIGTPLGAQEEAGADPAELVAEIRSGKWDIARVVALVGGLQEEELYCAAGWWLANADRALAAGKLPRKARSRLAKLRTAWRKARTSAGLNGKGVARKLLSHVEALARSKNFATARVFLDHSEIALAAWPDRASLRKVERLRKKTAAARDQNLKQLERLRPKGNKLRATMREELSTWIERALEEYKAWGCESAYFTLVRISAAVGSDHLERRARLRKASTKLGLNLTRKARLLVVSFKDVDVWVDGKQVGTQPGDMTMLMKSVSGEDAKPKPLTFEAWPGDRIIMTLRAPQKIEVPQGLPPIGPTGNHAVCVHLELDSRPVKGTAWFTEDGKTPHELDVGRLTPAVIGTVGPLSEGVSFESAVGGEKATKQVTFNSSRPDQSGIIIPVTPFVERIFAEQKVEGTWITGFERQSLYVLEVPAAQ